MEILWKEQGGATCHAFRGGLPDGLTADGVPRRTVWTTDERPGVMVFVYDAPPSEIEVDSGYFTTGATLRAALPGVEVGQPAWPA